MTKYLLSIALSFVFLSTYAEDLYISMGNSSGVALNYYVRIEDAGTAEGGAKYDRTTKSIINTSDGTLIRISGVDFGSGRYGDFSHVFIEYTNPTATSNGAYFDIYLENLSTLIASVPVEKTNVDEYVRSKSTFTTNVVGEHTIYVKWRTHSASIKGFGCNELKPLAEVKAVKSSSPIQYKFSSATFDRIEGVHNVKMVWKNQTANVYAVYFENTETSSIESDSEVSMKIETYVTDGVLHVSADKNIESLEIYSLSGQLIVRDFVQANSYEVALSEGIYVLRIKNQTEVVVKKISVD